MNDDDDHADANDAKEKCRKGGPSAKCICLQHLLTGSPATVDG